MRNVTILGAVLLSFLTFPAGADDVGMGVFKDLVGQKIPAKLSLRIQDMNLPKEKKIIILDLWATWCPGCVEAIPELNRLNAAPDVAVLGLTLEANEQYAEDLPALKEKPRYPIVVDESFSFEDKEHFKLSFVADLMLESVIGTGNIAIPYVFILNGENVVLWQGLAPEDLAVRVQTLLAR
jgi:thiol-disulfide isomerase/thioredoxin